MNVALSNQVKILFQNSGEEIDANYKKLFQREIVLNKTIQLNRLKRKFSFLEYHHVLRFKDRPEEGCCILSELIAIHDQKGDKTENLLWQYLNKLKKKEKGEVKTESNIALDLLIGTKSKDLNVKKLFKESLPETKEIKSELDPIPGYISGLSSSWWLCYEK